MSIKRSPERQPDRIEFARSQRKQANEFSHDVWQMIRAGRMLSEKFKREYPIGPYTLDFVCIELKLNIEVDGKDHLTDEGRKHDADRDAYLRSLGYSVFRIPGFRVTQDPIRVRNEIEAEVRRLREMKDFAIPNQPRFSPAHQCSPSPPAPLPEAGRGEQEKKYD